MPRWTPTESTEFVWEMTGGAPNPPSFFHTGLRHMAWKDFGGSHNTVKWENMRPSLSEFDLRSTGFR